MYVAISPRQLRDLAERHGGKLVHGAGGVVRRLSRLIDARAGELAPVLSARYLAHAAAAVGRGAFLLVDEELHHRQELAHLPAWIHPHASWALAELLDLADAPSDAPVHGDDCDIHPTAVLHPRVRLGHRVRVGAGSVIGAPGFGFAHGPEGAVRHIPHVGGVSIEDDVTIGPLCTIAAGTIAPTVVRRGAKLDAQVHIAHNCEVGEGTLIAAQSGLAGSVVVGKGVQIGGQVGIADHLAIGDGARIAAKSGVIGDVGAGETVAGYPAVARQRWLRGLAEVYRLVRVSSVPPRGEPDPRSL